MRVRVEFSVDVADDIRREINRWYGRPGLADRDEVKRWFEAFGRSMDDDLGALADEHAESPEEDDER